MDVDDQEKPEIEPVVFAEEKEKAQSVAQPLVTEKLYKKLEKLMKSSVQNHACSRGVKEVTKMLRKQHKGICLIAGDCTPIDVIAHLPVYCEDRSVPYAFIPTRRLLGSSIESLRGTSCILLHPSPLKQKETGNADAASYEGRYKKMLKKIKALQTAV